MRPLDRSELAAAARLIARLVPDARLRVVPRGGHLFLAEGA
ncbi:MAG TPA: hypothetical protein VF334_06875 [Polyangia bacterium]